MLRLHAAGVVPADDSIFHKYCPRIDSVFLKDYHLALQILRKTCAAFYLYLLVAKSSVRPTSLESVH